MLHNIIKSALTTKSSKQIFYLPVKNQDIHNEIINNFNCIKEEKHIFCYTSIDLVVCGHYELDMIKAYKICNFNHVNLFCIWDEMPSEKLDWAGFEFAKNKIGNFNWFLNKDIMNAWYMHGFNGNVVEKINNCLNKPFVRIS